MTVLPDDVRTLLEMARNNIDHDLWGTLHNRLCHQGTTTTTSYAALPVLAAMAEEWTVGFPNRPVALGASIVGSNDAPPNAADLCSANSAAIEALARTATSEPGAASSDTDFVYAIAFQAALRREPNWSAIESIANEEHEIECPRCGEHVYAQLVPPYAVTSWTATEPGPLTIAPTTVDGLAQEQAFLHRQALDHNRDVVADQLLHLFGTAICPECGDTIRLWPRGA